MSSRVPSHQNPNRRERRQFLDRVNKPLDDPLYVGRIGFTIRVVGERMSSKTSRVQSRDRVGRRQLLDGVNTFLDYPLRSSRLGYSFQVFGGRVSSRTLQGQSWFRRERLQPLVKMDTSLENPPWEQTRWHKENLSIGTGRKGVSGSREESGRGPGRPNF